MQTIVKAGTQHLELVMELGRQSFMESHGASASEEDIAAYVTQKYSSAGVLSYLEARENECYILSHGQKPAGYSGMVFNAPHALIAPQNVTRLDRLYLLREFYNLRLGQLLLDHNLALSQQQGQAGMWLYVWKENERAVKFYRKNGFGIIGSHNFPISATHSNPNFIMYREYLGGSQL